jgi:RNA polymerase sigma-70 factor, ECF subfamily
MWSMGMALRQDQARDIEACIPYLRRYARVLTGDVHGADDLVQDCLERAIRRIDQFQAGTNLRAWLFTILHNVRCDQHRRSLRRGPELPLEEGPDRVWTPPDQMDDLYLQDFRRAFAKLSEAHRQVLLLTGVEGLNYEEAAGVLGVEVGTVKSRVFRAREQLRREQEALGRPVPRARWQAAA